MFGSGGVCGCAGAAGSAPGCGAACGGGGGCGVPSASTKVRPSAGRRPSTSKTFDVTNAMRTISGRLASSLIVCRPVCTAATPLNTSPPWSRRSLKSPGANGKSTTLRCRRSAQTIASRSGSSYGSGRSRIALTTLKIAVLEPMPSASVMIAVAAKPGFLRRPRSAKPISLPRGDMGAERGGRSPRAFAVPLVSHGFAASCCWPSGWSWADVGLRVPQADNSIAFGAMAQSETVRVEAFSDGVYAIAITLLILEIVVKVPHGAPDASRLRSDLLHLWPSYLAYLASFATIGVMWLNHHRLFSLIAKCDDGLMGF